MKETSMSSRKPAVITLGLDGEYNYESIMARPLGLPVQDEAADTKKMAICTDSRGYFLEEISPPEEEEAKIRPVGLKVNSRFIWSGGGLLGRIGISFGPP